MPRTRNYGSYPVVRATCHSPTSLGWRVGMGHMVATRVPEPLGRSRRPALSRDLAANRRDWDLGTSGAARAHVVARCSTSTDECHVLPGRIACARISTVNGGAEKRGQHGERRRHIAGRDGLRRMVADPARAADEEHRARAGAGHHHRVVARAARQAMHRKPGGCHGGGKSGGRPVPGGRKPGGK